MEDDPFGDNVDGKGKYYPTAVLTNKKLLLDPSLTDLTIKIGSESVLAHAAVVSCRCEEIIPFVQDDKSKKRKKHEVKLKDGTVKSASILQKILEFVYTGAVDFPKLSNEEILFLNAGARNLNLVRLVYLCERWLKDHLSMDNVFHLLKAATDLNETRVKSFCLNFALQNYTDFISNKDGIKILGIELFQEVVAAFNPQGLKQSDDFPNIPQDHFLEDFRRLYESMPYSDWVFIVDGEQIKVHKAILAAHSDQFHQLFKAENSIQQDRISAKSCKSMIKYLYYGDEDIEQGCAVELVAFSRRYKLHSLLRVCEEKIRINLSVDTILDVLSVAYMPSDKQDLNEEIKAKSFPFILENLTQVQLHTLRLQHPMMAIDLLFKLQEASKKGEMNFSGLVSAYVPPVNNNNNNNNNYNNAARGSSNNNLNNSNLASSGGYHNNLAHSGPVNLNDSNNNNNNNNNFPPPPPPLLSQSRPPPPPRGDKASSVMAPSPPPRGGDKSSNLPPPVLSTSGNLSARGEPSEDEITIPTDKSLKKKSLSAKDLKSQLSQGSISKKEEAKRKKEEAKRLEKEQKERKKMEKKFKS